MRFPPILEAYTILVLIHAHKFINYPSSTKLNPSWPDLQHGNNNNQQETHVWRGHACGWRERNGYVGRRKVCIQKQWSQDSFIGEENINPKPNSCLCYLYLLNNWENLLKGESHQHGWCKKETKNVNLRKKNLFVFEDIWGKKFLNEIDGVSGLVGWIV